MERSELLTGLPGRIEIMGASVDPWTMEQTVDAARRYIDAGEFAHLIGVNADKLLQMRDDPWMTDCVNGCEVVNTDGTSMVMAAKKLGMEIPGRVAGIDLMSELCNLAAAHKYPVYLLGAKPEVVEKTAAELSRVYDGMPLVGYRDGYFSDDEWAQVAAAVRDSGAKIIFVGITSPKKERLIEYFRQQGLKGVFVGVGGSFDVISGMIPRAPMWMQNANLEWLFRMMQEPGRLVKRYVVGNTRFLWMLRSERKKMKREGAR